MDGWIKLHRQIKEHWIWQNPEYLKAWLTILIMVNHEEKKILIHGEVVVCSRGQSILSLSNWAKLFGGKWSIQRIRTFFNLLENDSMITSEGLRKTTRVTVCNYDTYQESQQTNNKQTTSKQQATNKQLTTNKKDKEREEGKEINIIHDFYPFIEFWKDYGKSSDKTECEKKFLKLSPEEKKLIKVNLPKYLATIKEKKFQKNPLTYINQKSWNDFSDEEFLEPQTKLSFVKSGNSIDLSFKPKR